MISFLSGLALGTVAGVLLCGLVVVGARKGAEAAAYRRGVGFGYETARYVVTHRAAASAEQDNAKLGSPSEAGVA